MTTLLAQSETVGNPIANIGIFSLFVIVTMAVVIRASKRNATAAEVANFEPNYEGSPIVAGGGGAPSARGDHRFEARAGHHLAPQNLSDGANVFDRLGNGYTLLNFAPSGTVDKVVAVASREGIPLTVVDDGASTDYGASLILVRPDHYVAWSGDDPSEGADALLKAAASAS